MSYQITRGELLDRMSIVMLKIAHGEDLMHELSEICEELQLNQEEREGIIDVMRLTMVNTAIFVNEDEVRELSDKPELTAAEWAALGKKLLKTHRLNADRSQSKKIINERAGDRIDPKLNYVSGQWQIKFYD